jgi:hypothetical protein
MMQRKLILAALALVLTISSASAQGNPYRLPQMPAQATSFNKLLYAYRLYAFVEACNLGVYINETELDRARLKVQSIEKDLLPTVSDPVPDAWVKTFFHGDTLDTVALFSEAVDSIRGMSTNSDRCHLTLRALLAMPSGGGNMVVEKDFWYAQRKPKDMPTALKVSASVPIPKTS